MRVLPQDQARKLLERQHHEYVAHQYFWRRALDSLEGGDAYRFATYGPDPLDPQKFVTNLVRHKKEYPPPPRPHEPGTDAAFDLRSFGGDSYERAAEDSFKLRQARTPTPRHTADAIQNHLAKIYARPIHREGPDDLRAFWADVDGTGTSIDDWLAETGAEIFLALGQIDLLFDHPPVPPGAAVLTDHDVARLGLRACHLTVLLPTNIPWWTLDAEGCYAEVLVREFRDSPEGKPACVFRHWDAEGSVLYAADGKALSDVAPHTFGRVPIARIVDRKKLRGRHVGQSRYEGVLEHEREFYNEDSELILANTLQAHPTLQGPKEAFGTERELEVGPGGALPIITNQKGDAVEWSYVSPPKEGAEFLQTSKADLVDRMDRLTGRTKPAGAAGMGKTTVAQSGISKELDQRDGNALLAKLAKALRKLELRIADMALLVLRDGRARDADLATVRVTYPGGFNLLTGKELAEVGAEIQAFVEASGALPEFETALLRQMMRESLPGLDPDALARLDAEAEAAVLAAAVRRAQDREAAAALGVGLGDDPASELPPSGREGAVIPAA